MHSEFNWPLGKYFVAFVHLVSNLYMLIVYLIVILGDDFECSDVATFLKQIRTRNFASEIYWAYAGGII